MEPFWNHVYIYNHKYGMIQYIYILVFWSFLSIHSLKPSLGGMWTIRNRISMDPKSLPYLVWDHLETIWGPFGFTVNQQPEMRSVGDDSLKHHARRDFGQYKQSGHFAARTIQPWKFEPYPVYSIAQDETRQFQLPHIVSPKQFCPSGLPEVQSAV